MRNLIAGLIISILCSSSVFGQLRTEKYLRKNKDPETLIYGDSSIYSRSFYCDDKKIVIGNSNGAIYFKKWNSDEVTLLFKQPTFKEVRDLEYNGKFLVGMQSDTDGKLVLMDGGGPRKIVHPEIFKGVFLDGMDFSGSRGFMMGDPKDGYLSLFHTNDHGQTWEVCEGRIEAFTEEAAFAASGTTVQVLNDSTYVFVTGGMESRFFKSTDNGKTWLIVELPYYPGKTIGPYSMCFANDSIGVVVGGNYLDPDLKLNTTFTTKDGGETWMNIENPPRGYRSCVIEHDGVFYACGQTGIDVSFNNGDDWAAFANGPFFAMKAHQGKLFASTVYGELKIFNLLTKEDE